MSITIVGASLAGLQAAQALRRADYTDPITMVGDEPHYPYDRPPLSKQYLAGDWDDEKLRLRAAADPEELGITWRLGSAAASLDLDGQSIELADGSTLAHDGLIIATGAAARSLPGDDLVGVHLLRSLDDARGLRAAFDQQPSRVCVIGAGFIGAEVAATARGRGLEVTMVEAAEAPLARVLDLGAGQAIAELHRSHGVDVRLGVGVSRLIGESGRVTAVELADGSVIKADVVVVGIGVVPNTEWLEGSSLTIDNGVVCDATCLAAPGVVAAGDVARWPNTRFGADLTRVEQWDNAVDQGSYVAKRLLAWLEAAALGDTALGNTEMEPFAPVPWFWSDQYDRKIQLAGLPRGEAELVHGTLEEQRFVQLYGEGDKFFGALAWNRPRQAIMARQLLERGGSMAEARTELGDA